MARVLQYERRKPSEIFAVLWSGNAIDLVEMPEFNDLVSSIVSIDMRGTLKIKLNGIEQEIPVREFYIIHETNRGFRVTAREVFEQHYCPVPLMKPKE